VRRRHSVEPAHLAPVSFQKGDAISLDHHVDAIHLVRGGAAQGVLGFPQSVQRLITQTQIAVGNGEVRIELDCLPAFVDRPLVLAERRLDDAPNVRRSVTVISSITAEESVEALNRGK
jgi:hypothetical protein